MVEKTRIGMPLDEFIRLYDEAPFELIDGERIPLMPGVAGHSKALHALLFAIYLYISTKLMGEVLVETTFILPERYDANWVEGFRTPDLMYFAGDRLSAYRDTTPDWRERPYPLVPDLVAEIVSPNDKVSEMDAKIDKYLADGVRLIWVIDPQRHKAVVYAPDLEQPIHLAGDQRLDGGDMISGFHVPLSTLFD